VSRAFAFVVLSGCTYISHPYVDPGDPVTVEIINRTSSDVYLTLNDGSPLDVALKFSHKGGAAVQTRLSCADVSCAAGCAVTPCALAPAVRELSPGEGLLVEWENLVYAPGDQVCGGVPCVNGSRAAEGRYLATVCFARAIKAAGAAPMERDATDPKIIGGAAIDGEECRPPLELGFPGYNVRYEIEVR
jgi:hypothetical protein